MGKVAGEMGQLPESILNSDPALIAERLTADPVLFVTVTVFAAEVCPSAIFPHERDAGARMSPPGAAVPAPVNDAVVGDPGASCDTVN